MTVASFRSQAGDRRIQLHSGWDARALETENITPKTSAAVVFLWEESGWPDGGPSPHLAGALASGLVRLGEVAFRLRGAPPDEARLLGRSRVGLFGPASGWRLVAASSPTAVSQLFEEGWSSGDQVAVIAPEPQRAILMLTARDLSEIELQQDEVVFAAVVDGAGGLLAAASPERLVAATASIADALRAAGIAIKRC